MRAIGFVNSISPRNSVGERWETVNKMYVTSKILTLNIIVCINHVQYYIINSYIIRVKHYIINGIQFVLLNVVNKIRIE